MRLGRGCFAAFAVLAALAWVGVVPAAATTFCVPSFHAACPSGGGNLAEADLEKAMGTSGSDGQADKVIVAAGTFSENGSGYEPQPGSSDPEIWEVHGSDPLEIVGAGPGTTFITSTSTVNGYLVNLNYNNSRAVTFRDLTALLPASFPDDGGAGFQIEADDALENVDIESRNPGADGVSMIGGGIYRDGRLFGAAGGSIGDAFRTNGAGTGEMRIERTRIEDASWGISVDSINVITRIKRTEIIDPVAYGLRITSGGFAVMDNSIITVDDGLAVSAKTGTTEVVILNLRHTTIVDTGGDSDPVIDVGDDFTPKAGSINAVFNSVIIAGNEEPLKCDSPMSNTALTMRYSYFFHSAQVNGNCSIPTINTIDAFGPAGPPQFLGPADFHLPAGSPAIDSGDPATVTLPTDDLDGAPRPVDGDGDGEARRDIGAFEYQPPTPEQPGGGGGGEVPPSDITAPQTKIVSGPGKKLAKRLAVFRFRSSEPGSRFRCRLDGRKVAACKAPKRFRKLTPGRHVFRVWAIDAAGNKDPTAAMRRFRVRVE